MKQLRPKLVSFTFQFAQLFRQVILLLLLLLLTFEELYVKEDCTNFAMNKQMPKIT
jgi:hypothetical protein